jgi:SAM-dependent methyltransferase
VTVSRIGGSFRDPAGYVFRDGQQLFRTVSDGFEPEYLSFRDSGLYGELIGDGLLVEHEEVDPGLAPSPCARLLQIEQLPFVTYPWEWSTGQLRAAAELTLEIQHRALRQSLSLRDASAFNVQFRGHKPIFIDTLSFARTDLGRPWQAYGQFCRHFVGPLALRALVDPRLAELQQRYLDGIPLDLVSQLLPPRTKLSPGLALHVHAHARSIGRSQRSVGRPREIAVTARALQGTVEQLRRLVRTLDGSKETSPWSEYEQELSHYPAEALALKRSTIKRWLHQVAPHRTVDLGSNRGEYAREAAGVGSDVLAIDGDHATVELTYAGLVDRPPPAGSVTPIFGDLLNPSADVGWANEEREALTRRTNVDLVLALALIHHLAVQGEVPLEHVLVWLARHGRILALEWVPPDDAKVAEMLATRREHLRDYSESAFQQAVGSIGRTIEVVSLTASGRSLHLIETSR